MSRFDFYTKYFKNLEKWCFSIAAIQIFIFLIIFLGVSYTSTFIEIKESDDSEVVWVSKYEKYIVLASSLYMIVPFAFGNILLFGLLHRHVIILDIFVWSTIVNICFTTLIMLGSGIFLAVKGTPSVAYSLIAVGLIILMFFTHSVALVTAYKEKLESTGGTETDVDKGETAP